MLEFFFLGIESLLRQGILFLINKAELTLVSHYLTAPTILETTKQRLRQAEPINKAVALNKKKCDTDQKKKNIIFLLVLCHIICKTYIF